MKSNFTLERGTAMSVLAVCLSVSAALAAERADEFKISDAQLSALGIELVEVSERLAVTGVRFPGVVVLPPRQQWVVSAPVAGLVNQVLVDENQRVEAGTPLLVLSSPTLGQLQLAVVQAANHSRLSAQTLSRERALFKDGIIAERRVQEAEVAASNTRADLAQAKAAARLAGLNERDVAHLISSGQVLPELTVRANNAGTVISLTVKPGQRVTETEPLLRVAQLAELWIDVQVPGSEAAQWPRGATITLTGGIEAKVQSVSPIAEDAQLVVLRARLSERAANLYPGQFIQAELPVAAPNAREIPLSALARDSDQTYVFVRVDNHFVATPVEVLASTGQRAMIKGPLKPGQSIAATGIISLKAAWQGVGGMAED